MQSDQLPVVVCAECEEFSHVCGDLLNPATGAQPEDMAPRLVHHARLHQGLCGRIIERVLDICGENLRAARMKPISSVVH